MTSVITSDGVRLDVTDSGGDRPAVMLVAGFTAAAAVVNNPNGYAVVIDDCGHVVNLDQVDAFNAHLLDFLGAL